MERAVVGDSANSPDLASAIYEFEPEAAQLPVASARAARAPALPVRATRASSRKVASFSSETLESFHSETADSTAPPQSGADRRETPELFGSLLAARRRNWSGVTVGAGALVIVIAVGVPTSRWLLEPPVPAVMMMTGTLVIVTKPAGATAWIDGTPAGTTPFKQKIAAGSHTVELRGTGPSRTLAVAVPAGGQASQYIELLGPAADVGQLDVRSEPSGAFVIIDGVPRGTSPIVADLAPGGHTVILASDLGWVTQTVSIESGVKASLSVAASSWAAVAP